MSSAPAVPPAMPRPEEGRAAATRTLLALAGFAVLLLAATHLVLVGSRPLLLAFARDANTMAARPLQIESRLRAMPRGEAGVLVVGSSIVASDVDKELLGQRLGMDRARIHLIVLPSGNALETAMLTPLLERTRPGVVVSLATVWTLLDVLDLETVRFYDPRVAFSLFTWDEMLAGRQAHASRLFASLHFGIRHRSSLRHQIAQRLPGGAGESASGDPEALFFDDPQLGRRMGATRPGATTSPARACRPVPSA